MQFKVITAVLLFFVAQTMAAPPTGPQDKTPATPSGPAPNLANTTPPAPPAKTTPPGPKPTDAKLCHDASDCPKGLKCCGPPPTSPFTKGICIPSELPCPA